MIAHVQARDPHRSNEGICTSVIQLLEDAEVDVAGAVEDAALELLAELELELLTSVEYLLQKSVTGRPEQQGAVQWDSHKTDK